MEKQKLAISLILLSIVTPSVFACTFSYGNYGFLVYETRTQAWHIDLGDIAVGTPKSFNVTVECKEKTGEFLVTYYLEITGPASLCNDYLRLRWWDTDGADFIIGKDGDQSFSGIGTITWNSNPPTIFEAQRKNKITLTLTFLTTAAIGKYNAKMWVAFTGALSVTISPSSATLDVGQSQLLKSSVTGGTSPYTYRWYLNGVPVSEAKNPTWTFTPASPGFYTVYVKVTDSLGMHTTSNTAYARAKSR
jgi:hypothetical protein